MRRWITKVMKEGKLKRRGGREGEGGGGGGGGERVTRRYQGSGGDEGRSNGRSREMIKLVS